MAESNHSDPVAESGGKAAHVQTYERFISVFKWGTIAAAAVTAFVIFLMVS